MRRFGVLAAVLLAAGGGASGQVVTPVLTPPCVAKHCPGTRDRTTPAPATQSHYCPPGTVYMPQKGTCKVLPPASGP